MSDLDTTLITGASEGIGKCLAAEFARQGHNLILVARNEEKLRALAEELAREHTVSVNVFAQDLLDPNAAQILFEKVSSANLHVDILVNNAGMMYVDNFVEADMTQVNKLIQLNISSLVNMTNAFLQPMVIRSSGKIINVASIASFIPTPAFAVYGASKSFVLSFTESLSEELRYSGVDAHLICPGFTKTNMLQQAKGMEDMIPGFFKADPDKLAVEAYKACMDGETIYIDKLVNKALVQWAKYYPRWFVRGVSGFIGRFKS